MAVDHTVNRSETANHQTAPSRSAIPRGLEGAMHSLRRVEGAVHRPRRALGRIHKALMSLDGAP
jgi:hypothetical protein